ncbi:helix-turn-helix domain-containing protein [Alicyclobacillus sp. ALC3]|uniref:helix-turn-helix domain-containing protein n=1 Tax=Alicyclobacillus sp. ALC3 TaxID=2796143 RepID=UPI0023781377|nr:helix-turn-helix transcriptional regulator [Alicyclobacillus sp. ALC3]WDL96898.1 helix-turn-helix transcriptional regulator [Alicyclobacillus sp. ALC3]
MQTQQSFGTYLSELRVRYGFRTQKQLAEATGVSQATLSRIEAGAQRPTPDTLRLLAEQLRPVTYGELMQRAGYFDGVETEDWETDDIIDENDLDYRLRAVIRSLASGGEFPEAVVESLVQELASMFESEEWDVPYTVSGFEQLLREIDTEYKKLIFSALVRVKKLQSTRVHPSDDLDDEVRVIARRAQHLKPNSRERLADFLDYLEHQDKGD